MEKFALLCYVLAFSCAFLHILGRGATLLCEVIRVNEEYLTIDEAAAAVKVNHQTIRRWLKSGKLSGLRTSQNGRWRIPRSALAEALTAPEKVE